MNKNPALLKGDCYSESVYKTLFKTTLCDNSLKGVHSYKTDRFTPTVKPKS